MGGGFRMVEQNEQNDARRRRRRRARPVRDFRDPNRCAGPTGRGCGARARGMANAAVWAVGLILLVTMALTSVVSVYDKGILLRQASVPVVAAAVDGATPSAFAWLEDQLTRLRFDDRVADAMSGASAAVREGEAAPRIAAIAPADAPPTRSAAIAQDGSSRAADLAPALPSAAAGEEVDMAAYGKDLTPALVARFASPDRMVIVSFVNAHYMDFCRNWVRHLRAAGNRHFLVGALDDQAFAELRRANVPSFDMAASLTTRDFGWGSKVFKQAQQKKIAMFLGVLQMGYSVLLSDIDVMYLRDPFGFFRAVPQAHLLVSSDLLGNTVTDDGPEKLSGFGATLNVGIIFMRPTNATIELTNDWNVMCSKNLDFWEQAAFNQLVRRGMRARQTPPAGPYAERIMPAYKGGSIPTAVLPVSTFCSGHTAFVQRMPQRLGKQPYALHATFQFAGTNGKRHRMREWSAWEDEPAYYDPPNGLIALELQPPEALLRPRGKPPATVEQHFALVNWQLARIRSALVLAELTGRALIMPRLWCGFDRWWAPHAGRIPGSSMELPIQCPLDHVFNIEQGLRPERIREFPLLSNPLVPRGVLSSQFNLTLSAPLSADGVRAALRQKEAQRAKVLRVRDVGTELFQLVLSRQEQAAFAKRAQNYLGIWCCIRPPAPGKPGHIWCAPSTPGRRSAWARARHSASVPARPHPALRRACPRPALRRRYDLFWDVLPHKDRFGYEWTEAQPWYPRPSK